LIALTPPEFLRAYAQLTPDTPPPQRRRQDSYAEYFRRRQISASQPLSASSRWILAEIAEADAFSQLPPRRQSFRQPPLMIFFAGRRRQLSPAAPAYAAAGFRFSSGDAPDYCATEPISTPSCAERAVCRRAARARRDASFQPPEADSRLLTLTPMTAPAPLRR